MNLHIFQTDEELNEAAAGIIAGMVRTNPQAVLGLATGATPIGVYEELVRINQKGAISFKMATTFNLDEYVGLPPGHKESYRSYMDQHLFRHIDLPPSSAHIPNGNAPDLAAECQRYDRLLEAARHVDLQLLGIGHNGHIGFNEPDHALISGTHVVELKPSTRQANARFFASPHEVPSHAITMGVGTILKARTILLIARGSQKAEIIHKALTGPIRTEVPASLLQTHSNLVVMLDSSAGRLFQ